MAVVVRSWLGLGKTRTLNEWLRDQVLNHGKRRIAAVARTAADTRDVLVEGESGLLEVCKDLEPLYESSKRRVTFSNGAVVTLFSAERPDLLRGPQHDAAVCDELASWATPETWDNLLFGLRLGKDARAVVATTPRPTPLIRQLLDDDTVHVTRGSTFDNKDNLAPQLFTRIQSQYEGTRLGRQELYAEVLFDNPGALWIRETIQNSIDTCPNPIPELKRVVISVDPATTNKRKSDETGIIVVGVDENRVAYVLDDRSLKGSPDEWGTEACRAFLRWEANYIVAEENQGGSMVEHVIRVAWEKMLATGEAHGHYAYKAVRATRGKGVRAEPIAALYEQGRVKHARVFPELEDQMTAWSPGDKESPDRLDATVWGIWSLDLTRATGSISMAKALTDTILSPRWR